MTDMSSTYKAFEIARIGGISVRDAGAAGDGITDDSQSVLDAANLLVSAGGANLVFPNGVYRISQDTTLPAGVTIHFAQGAMFSVDSGVTLTVNSGIQAGLYQIFSGSGTVAGSLNVTEVYPQWWGAKGDGVTDDATAIQAAIDYCSSENQRLIVPPGHYYLLTGLVLDGSIAEMRGTRVSTILDFSGMPSGVGISIGKSSTKDNFVMQGFTLSGNQNSTALSCNETANSSQSVADCAFRDMRLYYWDIGIQTAYTWDVIFENIRVISCTNGLKLNSQTNSTTFISCAVTSATTGIQSTNNLGVVFVGLDVESISGYALTTYQAHVTFISPYSENAGTWSIGSSSEAGASTVQFIGGYGTINTSLGNPNAGLTMNYFNGVTSLAGTTSGQVLHRQTCDASVKRLTAISDNYENSTTSDQTLTFPVPYQNSPVVVSNTTGLTVSASKTELTITAPNNTTTYSGIIEVVGI